jgi:predicted aldo/keto reductase-like oxidoreductase
MFEEQLQRLGTDTIDFYLIHALSKDKWDKVKELGIIEFMETIKNPAESEHSDFPSTIITTPINTSWMIMIGISVKSN